MGFIGGSLTDFYKFLRNFASNGLEDETDRHTFAYLPARI